MPILPLLLGEAVTLPPRPHIRAESVEVAPVLDGKLDDEAWQKVPESPPFTRKRPDEGKVAPQRTTIKVVYDQDNIYVGIDCEQPRAPVTARLARRDTDTEADWVSIAIDSKRGGTSAYQFQVNAAGVLKDTLRFDDTDSSTDWDEVWDARTSVRKDGWSAEFKIPLRVLHFDPAHEQSWGFQANRWISALQEFDQWAYVPRAIAGVVSHYGSLDHLVDLHPTTSPLQVIPFVVGRVRRRDPTSSQLASGYDVWGSAGGDIKWQPTHELTFQATINPDFAQVEADQNVLNLSTFETYYPEKRPFFLEGFDIFSTPYQLLYTRRIGRAPPSPSLASGEELVDTPQAATIYGATKLTGKIADLWTVGTLQAITAENSVSVQAEDGSRHNRLVDPLSLFNIVRVKREVGPNAHIGLLATSLTHAEPTSSYPVLPETNLSPRERLCPTGSTGVPGTRCFSDAYVAALDGRWRSPGGDYSATAQAAGSLLEGGPVRSVADGTKIASGDTGGGVKLALGKDGGEHVRGWIDAEYETPKFTYNDVGYMQRANTIDASASLQYRTLKSWWETIETYTTLSAQASDNTYGLNLGRGAQLGFYTGLRNFWSLSLWTGVDSNRYDDRELGNGVALERAGGFWGSGTLRSDSTKPVAIRFSASGEHLLDGASASVSADFTFRLIPQFEMTLSPAATYNVGEPRSIGQLTPTGAPIFGKQNAPSLSTTLRASYTFMPRLTLQAYAQLFLASVHFRDFSYANPEGEHAAIALSDLHYEPMTLATNPDYLESALNINAVLRWEYKLGSVAYLVYQRSQVPNVSLNAGDVASINVSSVAHKAAASDALVLKLSYWWG